MCFMNCFLTFHVNVEVLTGRLGCHIKHKAQNGMSKQEAAKGRWGVHQDVVGSKGSTHPFLNGKKQNRQKKGVLKIM